MRQLAHKAIGVAFWVVLAVLWVKLVLDHKAGGRNIAYSLQYLAAIAGAVLAVTFWWIRHNTGIYQRKGPRNASPEMLPRIDEDRLGRPIRWQLDGGVGEALDTGHLIVDLDGEAKVYRRAA